MTAFVGKRLEETKTFSTADVSALEVRGEVGDVTLRGADRDDINVRIVKQSSSVRADVTDLKLRTERVDGTLQLYSEWTGDDGVFNNHPSMDFTIDVPQSITVERAETDVGDISVSDVSGDLQAVSSTGDVTIDGVAGTVTAESTTGGIEVTSPDTLGDVSAQTGDVTVDIPAIDGDTTIDAQTGDVEARISRDLDANLAAEADVGEVEITGLELSDASDSEEVTSQEVSGTLGDGGPELVLQTQTGDVELSALD
jgi:DUF4097 and DUF4098 domain-containing protein YvlB